MVGSGLSTGGGPLQADTDTSIRCRQFDGMYSVPIPSIQYSVHYGGQLRDDSPLTPLSKHMAGVPLSPTKSTRYVILWVPHVSSRLTVVETSHVT